MASLTNTFRHVIRFFSLVAKSSQERGLPRPGQCAPLLPFFLYPGSLVKVGRALSAGLSL